MRPLTFAGFLQSYVKALSRDDTLALSRLAATLNAEPRLTEPFLLWTVVTDRDRRLEGLLTERPRLQDELRVLTKLKASGRLESDLGSEDSALRPEYGKVWQSFVARRDARERDKRLRLQVRDRALQLEAQKRVTRYRMAKDLGLNPGNLHAFLSQGNATKLSLERLAELVDYLEAA